MCPCQAEINDKTCSVAVGWEEKGADSYPSSQSSNRHCGNPSCPIQQCVWIPLWPAWAPLLRDRSGQDKKDEKTLLIQHCCHDFTNAEVIVHTGRLEQLEYKIKMEKAGKKVGYKYKLEINFRYIFKYRSCKESTINNEPFNQLADRQKHNLQPFW